MSPKRVFELEEMFKDCSTGLVYVSAFPDRPEFKKGDEAMLARLDLGTHTHAKDSFFYSSSSWIIIRESQTGLST
jgi:hypothetical protein